MKDSWHDPSRQSPSQGVIAYPRTVKVLNKFFFLFVTESIILGERHTVPGGISLNGRVLGEICSYKSPRVRNNIWKLQIHAMIRVQNSFSNVVKRYLGRWLLGQHCIASERGCHIASASHLDVIVELYLDENSYFWSSFRICSAYCTLGPRFLIRGLKMLDARKVESVVKYQNLRSIGLI